MKIHLLLASFIIAISCQSPAKEAKEKEKVSVTNLQNAPLDTATFAGGCFWCVEAAIEQLDGVIEAVSGYAGGEEKTASYKLVSTGRTKHAESVQVYYDPRIVSYETLLEVFFTTHDPTQLNRQGPDVGPQYRSAIFFHSMEQKELAEMKIKELQPSYKSPIVTELNPYEAFYLAEAFHQNYEKNNPYNPYIQNVSRPKIDKVKEKYKDLLKDEEK